MTLYSPFDIRTILVTDVAGTPEIFSLLSVLIVAFILSRWNFSNRINMSLFVLFGVFMSTYIGGLYALIIILVGISVFYTLSKLSR